LLRILIFALNFFKVQDFQPQVLYFWKKIIRQAKKILTGKNCGGGNAVIVSCHDATANPGICIHLTLYCCVMSRMCAMRNPSAVGKAAVLNPSLGKH